MKNNKLALIVSLFILLALPSISLFYSFQGSKLRKIAMAELEPKGKVSDSVSHRFSGEFNYRIVGLACPDSYLLDSLVDQFIQENIQFVLLGDSLFERDFESSRIAQWNKKGSVIKARLPITSEATQWKPCHFELVNKQNLILNTYDLDDASQRRKMVEHIALLVTRK